MADEPRQRAYTAWTLQRIGRKFGEWHCIGSADHDKDDAGDVVVYLKDLPIGGFTGFLRLRAAGKPPPGLPKNLKRAIPAELSDDRAAAADEI